MGTTAAVSIASQVVPDGILVTLRNEDDRGVVFHTRTRSRLGRRTAHSNMFTVDPGCKVVHTFPGSSADGYHVEIQGPQALHVELAGLLTPGPEAVPYVSHGRGGLLLTLTTNDGPSVDLTVHDAICRWNGTHTSGPRGRDLPPDRQRCGGSYDVTSPRAGIPTSCAVSSAACKAARPSPSFPSRRSALDPLTRRPHDGRMWVRWMAFTAVAVGVCSFVLGLRKTRRNDEPVRDWCGVALAWAGAAALIASELA